MIERARSTVRVLLSGIGCLIAVLVIVTSFLVTLTGQVQLVSGLVFFSLSFAAGFGLGGACVASLKRRPKVLLVALAWAIGGAAGGAFLALSVWSMDHFAQQLRFLTRVDPLDLLLVGAVLAGALAIPYFVARAFLKSVGRQ